MKAAHIVTFPANGLLRDIRGILSFLC